MRPCITCQDVGLMFCMTDVGPAYVACPYCELGDRYAKDVRDAARRLSERLAADQGDAE